MTQIEVGLRRYSFPQQARKQTAIITWKYNAS